MPLVRPMLVLGSLRSCDCLSPNAVSAQVNAH